MLESLKKESAALSEAADWRALEEQLGSAEETTACSASVYAASLAHIRSSAQLADFVRDFQTNQLATQELPIILRAYEHARRGEAREIIALDCSLDGSFPSEALSNASQTVGRNQLRRLRALKTERLVTRYWDAVHAKKATGWHTVVFGVVLSVYSIPLRQGLNHYSSQTISGFLEAGGAALKLRLPEIAAIDETLAAQTPQIVERVLGASGANQIRCI